MNIAVPEVSDLQVAKLATELDDRGFAFIPNYIPADSLEKMQGFVSAAIEKAGNEYVHFNGCDSVLGSGLDELAHCERFTSLMHSLYEKGTGNKAPHQDFYQVLRCLAGKSGAKNSMIFHYDSYVVTALIPIRIPQDGMAGDLLMYPNTRKIHKTYLRNAVDKVLLDNPVSQRILRASVDSKWMRPMRIKMQPGNLYFFWGYRSIHTNEPCDPDKIRATALFHFANPHAKAN
jgi:hypothetical protein